MSITSAFAIFFVIWWLCLFAVLPWGVRTQEEHGDIVPGSAPSAPIRPLLRRKVIVTTVLAAAVFAVLYASVVYGGLSIDDLPFLPDFTPQV